jgi:thioredoxin reductase
MSDQLTNSYDVVVIGGGPAGLNGAMVLARSRRSVVVIDASTPRNRPAQAVHGLLGQDGVPPTELIEHGRMEVRRYGGQVTIGQVSTVELSEPGFIVALADGRSVRARRLLVASGLVDGLPAIPDVRERWGRDVIHCPYCHGWEVRDQAIGVLASGPMSTHQALLFRQLSDDVAYFTHSMPPNREQAEQLAARGIRLIDGEVTSLEVENDTLTGIRLGDGTVIPRRVLVVAPRMVAQAHFLADLGLKATEHPSGLGEHIPGDPTGRTEVSGVWVAGNVTDLRAQVGASAAAGAFAAAQINDDLIAEEVRRAIDANRDGSSAAS